MWIPALSLLSLISPVSIRAAASDAPGAGAPVGARPATEPVGSPMDPGSLPGGHMAVRVGFGLGNGPVGLGAQAAVGLGGVDLLADASLIHFCFFECEDIWFLGGGAQANLVSAGRFRIGARAEAQAVVADDTAGAVFMGGVAASWGGKAARVGLGLAVLGDYNPHITDRDRLTTWAAGPEASVEYFGDHLGVGATLGYAGSIAHDGYAGPIFSVGVMAR